jgi:hypothetical protein
MSYIGNQPAESYSAFQKQDFSTSATTSYTLDHPVANQNELALFINFVRQEPTTAYTASGTSLTLTSATSSSDDMYCVYLGKAIQTVNPPSGSVGSSQVAASIITGQTALASEPADTDEFLVSDAGTLKRIDYSLIKGGGITVADQWRVNNSPSGLNNNDIVGTSGHGNWEQNDTQYSNIGSAMSVADGVFTFPSTGIYLVSFKVSLYDATEQAFFGCNIRYTTNDSSYNDLAEAYTSLKLINSTTTYASTFAHSFLDVTDTSNVKVRFVVRAENGGFDINGSSSVNKTVATFIRLGDT